MSDLVMKHCQLCGMSGIPEQYWQQHLSSLRHVTNVERRRMRELGLCELSAEAFAVFREVGIPCTMAKTGVDKRTRACSAVMVPWGAAWAGELYTDLRRVFTSSELYAEYALDNSLQLIAHVMRIAAKDQAARAALKVAKTIGEREFVAVASDLGRT